MKSRCKSLFKDGQAWCKTGLNLTVWDLFYCFAARNFRHFASFLGIRESYFPRNFLKRGQLVPMILEGGSFKEYGGVIKKKLFFFLDGGGGWGESLERPNNFQKKVFIHTLFFLRRHVLGYSISLINFAFSHSFDVSSLVWSLIISQDIGQI